MFFVPPWTSLTSITHVSPCRGGYRIFQKGGFRPAIRKVGEGEGGCCPLQAQYKKRGGGGGGGEGGCCPLQARYKKQGGSVCFRQDTKGGGGGGGGGGGRLLSGRGGGTLYERGGCNPPPPPVSTSAVTTSLYSSGVPVFGGIWRCGGVGTTADPTHPHMLLCAWAPQEKEEECLLESLCVSCPHTLYTDMPNMLRLYL